MSLGDLQRWMDDHPDDPRVVRFREELARFEAMCREAKAHLDIVTRPRSLPPT